MNEISTTLSFVTPGYPTMHTGDLDLWWIIMNGGIGTSFIIKFADFDVGSAFLRVYTKEQPHNAIFQGSGSGLPDDIMTDTSELRVIIYADRPGSVRGVYFNISLYQGDYHILTSDFVFK